MKTMTIVGTRPELIKLSEVIKKLDKYTDHTFVHTGQNWSPELNDIFYKDLGLREPDVRFDVAESTLGDTIANIFACTQKVLEDYKPDAVIILGDTNSGLAGILAKRMKIPFFHLEAGNRCFDDNVPEEINRRILDHTADVNLVYTQRQHAYLMSEGLAKDRTFIMGSPMKEIFNLYLPKIKKSKILLELSIFSKNYFLVSLHRDENTEIKENLYELVASLNGIAEKYNLPIILSTHPRFMKKIQDLELIFDSRIQLLKPFGFIDYNQLQLHAKCVISDSGTIAEESTLLGFPAITIRNAIERPEAIDVGAMLMTGVNKENILDYIDIATAPTEIPKDYDIDNCSDRVLKIVLSYTPYVNKYVWSKNGTN